MRYKYIFSGVVISLILTSLEIFAQQSPWPMFRHDLRHTGRTNYTGPATPSLAWTFKTNGGITSSPSIGYNGTIYVGAGGYYDIFGYGRGGSDSSLYAINPDGSLKWQFKTGKGLYAAGIFSSPSVGPDGVVYFGALDQYLYALEDSVTYAKLKWKTKVGENAVYASPSLSLDGNIYIGCLDFSFNAFRVEDGERKWRYVTQWCVFSSAALTEDGTIYLGSKDHNLYAIEDSLAYWKRKWFYATGQFYDGHLIDSSPAIGSDGTIYFGTDPYGAAGQTPVIVDTNFWAVNPDGTLKWSFETGDGVESSPALGHDGTIYFGSYDSCLYAVSDNGSQGVLKWKFCTNGPIDCSPAVDGNGIIYFGSRDSTLYALYPDGNVRWTYKANGGFESSPTLDGNGYLYIGNFDGNLYAFGTGAPDLGVSSIDVPDLIKPEYTYSPAVTLNNYRSTFQNFDVVCLIDTQGYYVYGDTIHVSNLIGGQMSQKSFSPWLVGPDSNVIYTITAYTLIPEDDNTPNDTLLKNVSTSDDIIIIRGDVNSNSELSAADVVYLISYLFRSGPLPVIWETGDVNCDDGISVSDAIYLINYLWKGGPAPC